MDQNDKLNISIIEQLKADQIAADITNEFQNKTVLYEADAIEISNKILYTIISKYGKPYTSVNLKVDKYTPNDPELFYNQIFTIKRDLDNLFAEVNSIQNGLVKTYNKAIDEQRDIESSIRDINQKLGDYSIYSKYYESTENWFKDEFLNLKKVEIDTTKNFIDRAYVDTFAGAVTLGRSDISLSYDDDTTISVEPSKDDFGVAIGAKHPDTQESYMIDRDDGTQNIDSYFEWFIDKTTDELKEILSTKLQIDVIIDFNKIKLINMLTLTPLLYKSGIFPRVVSIESSLTGEDGTWESIDSYMDNIKTNRIDSSTVLIKVPDDELRAIKAKASFVLSTPELESMVFLFAPRKARKIKITLSQDQYIERIKDGISTKRWSIGIRDISIFTINYAETSELLSKPFVLRKPIDRISISVKDNIPTIFFGENSNDRNDWIKYYITVDEGQTWHRISPIEENDTFDTTSTGESYLVPEIIHINYKPTQDQINNNRSKKHAFVDTRFTPYSVKIKAVLRRPTSDEAFRLATPIIDSWGIQVHTETIDKYLIIGQEEYGNPTASA